MIGGFQKKDLDEFKFYEHCVIFAGSIELTEIIKKELPHCYPVAYCTKANYFCSKYYSYFGKLLFNDKYFLISLKELVRNKFFYWGVLGKEALIFIRPDSGQKPFQAQLLDLLDLDNFHSKNKDIEHELVLVSSPKNIQGEYRFIVTKYEEIIGHSTYRYQGQITKIPSVPTKALEFCKEVLKIKYFPDSVFVIDICEDNDENYWIMELNSFSSSGLYESNKENIVKRVTEIAKEEFSTKMNKI